MTLPVEWVAAVLLLVLGLLLALAGGSIRRRLGLGASRTISLDKVTLTSHRFGLTGRVDRLIRTGSTIIPEEWKSARVLRPHHRAQLGVYFVLIVRHGSVTVECGNDVTEAIRTATSSTGWG
jgi:hypothetical protein